MRSKTASLTEKWNNALTTEQRRGWNEKARGKTAKNRHGKQVPLSGFNLYLLAQTK